MTSVLFCGGLSKDVTEDHLRDLLSRHGRVRNVKLRIVVSLTLLQMSSTSYREWSLQGGVSTGQASALLTADGGITKALNALNGSVRVAGDFDIGV
jgi:RNA recognition motif-containing protein